MQTVTDVPRLGLPAFFFCLWSITGSWRIGSTFIVISCRMPQAAMITVPSVPSSTKGIATMVLSAFACAPSVASCYHVGTSMLGLSGASMLLGLFSRPKVLRL